MNQPDIIKQFNALEAEHNETLRVSWSATFDSRFEGLTFMCFNRWNRSPDTKGNGAIALRQVCDLADELGLVLSLWTHVEKLHAYYRSFGFELQGERAQDRAAIFKRKPDTGTSEPFYEAEDVGCDCQDAGVESEWEWTPDQNAYVCIGCGEAQ